MSTKQHAIDEVTITTQHILKQIIALEFDCQTKPLLTFGVILRFGELCQINNPIEGILAEADIAARQLLQIFELL